MKASKSILWFMGLFSCILSGCVQVRDYVGTKEGAFGLNVQQGFDKGEVKKDYYLTKSGESLNIRDTKNEIIGKIGSPDTIKTTLAGYEQWVYKNINLELFFENDKLNSFNVIKNGGE